MRCGILHVLHLALPHPLTQSSSSSCGPPALIPWSCFVFLPSNTSSYQLGLRFMYSIASIPSVPKILNYHISHRTSDSKPNLFIHTLPVPSSPRKAIQNRFSFSSFTHRWKERMKTNSLDSFGIVQQSTPPVSTS